MWMGSDQREQRVGRDPFILARADLAQHELLQTARASPAHASSRSVVTDRDG
jgi:hypothetical protein